MLSQYATFQVLITVSSLDAQVWRINGQEKTLIPSAEQSKFYSGDCYIFQYSYPGEDKEEILIGTWFGKQSVEVNVSRQLKSIYIWLQVIFHWNKNSYIWKIVISFSNYNASLTDAGGENCSNITGKQDGWSFEVSGSTGITLLCYGFKGIIHEDKVDKQDHWVNMIEPISDKIKLSLEGKTLLTTRASLLQSQISK